MKRYLFSVALLLALLPAGISFAATAASAEPVTVAIFPLKNAYGEVKYDSLAWSYADSLFAYLNTQAGAGTVFTIIPMDDIRDQMLALNVDPNSPSYETEIFKIAKALGAKKVMWGSYLVKYEKANIEIKVIDAKTLMPDRKNIAEKIRAPFPEALSTVAEAGTKLLPGLH